jgi:hypothetical protein
VRLVRSWCVRKRRHGGGSYHLEVKRRRYLKPRRLVVDEDLYRRRVQGETLRELAVDYGVSHTTLSRHLAGPNAKATLRAARVALRLEEEERRKAERAAARQAAAQRSASRPLEDLDANEAPHTRADVESPPALRGGGAAPGLMDDRPSRRWGSEYANWLDDRDHGRPLTRRELWSTNDELAAEVTTAGGGLVAVIEVTRLNTEANVRRLIDPEIVERADENDAHRMPPSNQAL